MNKEYKKGILFNVFERKGVYTWPNGNIYKGYFKNDKRDKLGVLFFKNGRK